MKADFLKIAGVKNNKEFYQKFPDRDSFIAKCGKKLMKYQSGGDLNGNGIPDLLENYFPTPNDYTGVGGTNQQFGSAIPQGSNVSLPRYGVPQEPIFDPSQVIQPITPGVNVNQNRAMVGEEALPAYTPIAPDATSSMMKGLPGPLGKVLGGFASLEGEKEKRRQAVQAQRVSEIALKASTTRPEQIERDYVRPEDNVFSTNQFFPANGVGTNVLAKDGAKIKKAQNGWMQNTGFGNFMTSGDGQALGQFADYATGNNAGGMIGGGFGEGIGQAIGGPVGGQLGNIAGTLIGGVLDTNGRRTKRAQAATNKNIMNMALNQVSPSIQAGYASHLKKGGRVNSDMDGDLQTHWGGEAETMSYNPFLPDNGETVMFKGNSHDETDGRGNTGIGITFGDSPVEVEEGEPAVKLRNGGGSADLTVFGNLRIPDQYVPILGDEDAKGKKFKNYVADLSKVEDKQNKLVEKTVSELDTFVPINSFDKLKMSSLEANMIGATMKLKDIAEKKQNAAMLQDAINQTAEEHGFDADALARGKVKKAKYGMTMDSGGTTTPETTVPGVYEVLGALPGSIDYNTPEDAGGIFAGSNYQSQWVPKVNNAFSNKDIANRIISSLENYSGQDANDVKAQLSKQSTMSGKLQRAYELATDRKVGPYHNILNSIIDQNAIPPAATVPGAVEQTAPMAIQGNEYEVLPYKRSKFADIFNTVLPFIRPTDQEGLDANQLMGEMYAMSSNQLDPVQAQTYQPELNTPYDISYQDQLNANQSDYRSMQRLAGHNTAAQAILNAQKYGANAQVLGEQFRANQSMRDRVFGENRNVLNDAKLKNLAIFDQQYQRQSQAVSNTKATTQAAINSISDKYAKNKLENRTLGVYENLYNYRYDASGRAINMNPLAQFNMPYVYGPDGELTHIATKDENGKITGYTPIAPPMATPPISGIQRKNGGSTKKSYAMGDIVKSFK